MKAPIILFALVFCAPLRADDGVSGTCPTIHGCPAPGMTEKEWQNDHSSSRIPSQSTYEAQSNRDYAKFKQEHHIKPAIGMKISADELFEHHEWPCDKINRTFTVRGERDQVVCAHRYIYIEGGVITAIQQ